MGDSTEKSEIKSASNTTTTGNLIQDESFGPLFILICCVVFLVIGYIVFSIINEKPTQNVTKEAEQKPEDRRNRKQRSAEIKSSSSHLFITSQLEIRTASSSQSTAKILSNSQSTANILSSSQSTAMTVANGQSAVTISSSSRSTARTVANSQSTTRNVTNSQSTADTTTNSQSVKTANESIDNSQLTTPAVLTISKKLLRAKKHRKDNEQNPKKSKHESTNIVMQETHNKTIRK